MAIRKLPSTGDAPQSTPTPTGLPEGMSAGGAADSAGFPWAGRTFDHHETAFSDDDGSTPEEYTRALERLRRAAASVTRDPGVLAESGSGAVLEQLANAHTGVLGALHGCRLLVPLVTHAGDVGVTDEGKPVEKTQELSIVTVTGPDGRTVMPVFTSISAMHEWDATARPIPVPGPQVAVAAAEQDTPLVIVDPGNDDTEFGVRSTELESVATGESVLPAWARPDLQSEFEHSVDREEAVASVQMLPGDAEGRLRAPEVDVVVALRPGLDEAALHALIGRLQHSWSRNDVIAREVDSLRVRAVPALA
jgi:hypothetical protein